MHGIPRSKRTHAGEGVEPACENPVFVEGPNGSTTGNHSSEWIQPPVEQEGLTRYVATLRERIWIVIAIIAITTGIAILYVATANKQYEASADVFVNPEPADDDLPIRLPVPRQSSDPTRDVETASRLVTNIDVAERVRKELESPLSAQDLLGKINAEPLAQSNIVVISARAASPEEATELVNTFAEQAIAEQTQLVHDFIDENLPRLKDSASDEVLQELQSRRATDDTTLEILTPAVEPTAPVAPRPLLSIAGGLLAGVVLGIAAAFALQVLDPRLRREEQLRRLYRLPILARIPKEQNTTDKPLDPLELSPAAAEAYRTLRGTLAVQRRDAGGDSRAILVTGSSPSEGKSTTAVNLATSLAAAGNSVILIESDLRRPSIARALGVNAEHGVVSVLIESVALEEALVTTESFGPNFGMLLADYEGGWISELFALPAARQMVEDARKLADYVIIDSPPLTDVVDALPLASYVDDVLMVVRLGRTTISKLTQLGELLAENDIRPAGFAVVGTPRPTRSDYHYYNARGSTQQRRDDVTARPS